MTTPTHPASRLATLVPILLGLAVAAVYAWGVHRYYFLSDDCFISFRYALNLVEGHGLVYNPGERVEGYTNFSWTLLMAAVMKLGASPELWSNILAIASGVGILLILAAYGARQSSWRSVWIWIAPFSLAANRTFETWSTSGLETQLFSFLVLAASLQFLKERESSARYPWKSSLLFSLAALTRPEGIMFFGIAGFFFLVDVLRKRVPLRSLVAWSLVFAVIVGDHFLWRYRYYGFWLPNTFYAKVSGFWFEQGLHYLRAFVDDHGLIWVAILLLWLPIVRPNRNHVFLLTVLAIFVLYIFYTGGDHYEYRFLNVILPFLFLALQESVRHTVQRFGAVGWRRPLVNTVALGLGALIVWCGYRPNTFPFENRHGISGVEGHRKYSDRRVEEGLFLRSLVEKGYLTGEELISVGGAGALPYYSRLPTLDFRGLNDVTIAHQEIEERGKIAHEKAASFDYIKERGVIIYDVLNRIVFPEGVPRPIIPRANRPFYKGPVHCVQAEGRFLLFATTLNRQEFMQTFRKFRIHY